MISDHITVKIYMEKNESQNLGGPGTPAPPPKWRPWHEGTILIFDPVWFGCGSLEAAP